MPLAGGVRARFAVLVGASSVVPLLLLGAVAAALASRTLERSIVNGNGLEAQAVAGEIDTYLRSWEKLLQGVSAGIGRDVTSSGAEIHAVLQDEKIAFYPFIVHLELCAKDGALVASAESATDSPPCPPTLGPLRSGVTGSVLEPEITLTLPIQAHGQTDDSLVAVVDITDLWGIIAAVSDPSRRARLAASDGRVIAHGDPAQRYEVFSGASPAESRLATQIANGTDDALPRSDEYLNGANAAVLGVGAKVPQTSWAVVIEEEESIAFRPIRQLRLGLIIGGALFAVLGALVGLLFARSLIRPLDALRAQADAIGSGELRSLTKDIGGPVELRALASAMNRMASELKLLQDRIKREERFAVLARTASGLVHDLKQPIAAVRMAAGAVIAMPDDPLLRNALASALDGAFGRIDGMFEDVRRVVRNEAISLNRRPIDLSELAVAVADELRPSGGGLLLEVDAPSPARVVADPRLLQRVLSNLIRNALDAQAEHGPGTVRVLVRASEDAGARVVVADQGGGIAEDRLADLFVSLESTKKSGFGVGLAAVKKIIEEHGGTVSVESPAGEGARFTVLLPTSPTATTATGARSPMRP